MAKIMVGPKAYDYRWPSGSITAFPAGWTGTTKQAIVEDAVAKGWGKDGAEPSAADITVAPKA